MDEIREIHGAGTIEIFRTVGAAGGLTHRPVPRVLTSHDPTIGVRQDQARAGGGHTASAFGVRTVRACAVGAVALEDAAGGGAIFGRRGFNTSAIVQTAGAFGEANRGAARGAGAGECAAHQSAIGGRQTQTTSGGRNAASAARVAVGIGAQGARTLPRPACVQTVVGRLGAAHSRGATRTERRGAFDVGAGHVVAFKEAALGCTAVRGFQAARAVGKAARAKGLVARQAGPRGPHHPIA